MKKHKKKINAAVSLYQKFTGHIPEFIDKVTLKVDNVAFAIGYCDGIMYETIRDGKRENYIHKFRKGSRPVLASSSDGKQLYLLAGAYKFTERGIEDKRKR